MMEAGNVVLVPAVAAFFAQPANLFETLVFGLAAIACGGFLLVGSFYWSGKHDRIEHGGRKKIDRALTIAVRAKWPLLFITAASIVVDVYAIATAGFRPALIAASVLTLLAGLEYVNYYQLQLQHFDRWSDFQRLMTERKLRQAHMARDLAARRRAQR